MKCEIYHIEGEFYMRYRYGLLGFLSLIGVVGLIIEEPAFYPFFAFVLFFEYFFIKPDEMFLENMRKAASWAFYVSLLVTTAGACCLALFGQTAEYALRQGIGWGFACSLIVFSCTATYFEWKDSTGASND